MALPNPRQHSHIEACDCSIPLLAAADFQAGSCAQLLRPRGQSLPLDWELGVDSILAIDGYDESPHPWRIYSWVEPVPRECVPVD